MNDSSLMVERLSPLCYKYEQILADIVLALKKSENGEIAIPCQPLGLQASTLRLNLREARNGFKAGVKSDKIPSDFDLSRLEFSLSTTCRGVTVRDSERKRTDKIVLSTPSFKSDYDFGVVGFFSFSEPLVQLIIDLQKACSSSASIYGAVKFKCKSDAELQTLKKMFTTAVDIKIRDGLVEVAL